VEVTTSSQPPSAGAFVGSFQRQGAASTGTLGELCQGPNPMMEQAGRAALWPVNGPPTLLFQRPACANRVSTCCDGRQEPDFEPSSKTPNYTTITVCITRYGAVTLHHRSILSVRTVLYWYTLRLDGGAPPMPAGYCLNCQKEVSTNRKFCRAPCRTKHFHRAKDVHIERLKIRIAELETKSERF
jgi:hypothetical protein